MSVVSSFLKTVFGPIFAPDLVKCRADLGALRAEYAVLDAEYNAIYKSFNENKQEMVIVEVPVVPKQFASKADLISWLKTDPISDIQYIVGTFDCDDFARAVQSAALADGYLINVTFDPTGYFRGNGHSHALCMAVIADEFVVFEPQTDEILCEVKMD